jgi:hypothetical protein
MPSKLWAELKSPSPAFVVSCVALFVALGGSSYAAVRLSKNSVKSVHIAPGAVRSSDIARNAIRSSRVLDGTLGTADFGPGVLLKGDTGATGQEGPIGPTEGQSTDFYARTNTQLTHDGQFDQSSITTAHAGRLLVVKTIPALQVNCTSMSTWKVWAELDDVRVPGTVIRGIPNNTPLRGVTLVGVTSEVVPAGAHHGATAFDCDVGAFFASSVTPAEDFTAVVLGGG